MGFSGGGIVGLHFVESFRNAFSKEATMRDFKVLPQLLVVVCDEGTLQFRKHVGTGSM